MRNRTLLLATTAIVLMSATATSQAGSLYVSILGGMNNSPDESTSLATGPFTAHSSSEVDSGFVLGGAIGTRLNKWLEGLRTELEVSYRRNDASGDWGIHLDVESAPFSTLEGNTESNVSTFAIMANAWYDIDAGWKMKPYLGGGAGWARSRSDGVLKITSVDGSPATETIGLGSEANGFAWQLGAGFNYEVSPGVDLGLGYRYFRGPSGNDEVFGGKNNMSGKNHTVAASLTVEIN